MSLERIAPVKVGTHACNDSHAAFFRSGGALAKEIPIVEELSVSMERHLRRIKRKNAGHANKDEVGPGGVPVVSPLLNVHDGRIVLCHVALANAANLLLPGLGRRIKRSKTRRQRDELRCGAACRNSSDFLCRESGDREGVERGRQWKSNCASLKEGAAIQHCGFLHFVYEGSVIGQISISDLITTRGAHFR